MTSTDLSARSARSARSVRSARSAQDGAKQAAGSVWVARLARLGFGARGVLYVLLAYLAVRVAFGQSNLETDREGALHTIARGRFGPLLLGALAAGFAGYAVWQLTVAVLGSSARAGSDKAGRRGIALINGLLYAVFFVTTVELATGSSNSSSSDKPATDLTARFMQHGIGRTLVAAVGVAVIVTGAMLMWRGLTGKREIRVWPPSPRVRRSADALGAVGITARGVIIGAAGVFVLQAAIRFDPRKAKGLDGTLKSFAQTPAGPWLLVVIALGLLAFGLYSLAEAAYGEL